jgi:anti-sigma B factor antagonist
MTPNRFEPKDRGRFQPSRPRPQSFSVTGRSRSQRAGSVARDAMHAATRIELAISDGTARLTAEGQLDLTCGDRFIACLRELRDTDLHDLVVDLREVTFIDSTGLSLLLKADGLARQNEFELHVVRSPAEIVQAVLEATGVDKFLPLIDEPPTFDA